MARALSKSVSDTALLTQDLTRFLHQGISLRTALSHSGFASDFTFWHQLVNNCLE